MFGLTSAELVGGESQFPRQLLQMFVAWHGHDGVVWTPRAGQHPQLIHRHVLSHSYDDQVDVLLLGQDRLVHRVPEVLQRSIDDEHPDLSGVWSGPALRSEADAAKVFDGGTRIRHAGLMIPAEHPQCLVLVAALFQGESGHRKAAARDETNVDALWLDPHSVGYAADELNGFGRLM